MKQASSSKQRERDFQRTRNDESTAGDEPPEGGISAGSEKKARVDKATRQRYLREYRKWLWPYRWGLVAILLLALVTTGLDMVWPLAIRLIMDGVLVGNAATQGARTGELLRLGGLIIFVLLLKQALETIRSWRTASLDARVTIRLRRRLFDKFLSLPLGKLSEMKSGGIVSRLSSDVDAINGLVQMALISPTVAAIRLVLTLGVLIWMSWRLAMGALVVLPLLAIISLVWLRRVRPVYRSAQQDRQEVDGRVNETFGGIRVVRAFRRESREDKGYALGRHTILRKYLWAVRMELALETVWGLLIPGSVLLIVWYGGYLVIEGKAKIGDLFAFQIFAALLIQPVWAIVSSVSQTNKSVAALERVFEVLEMPVDKPDVSGAIDAPRVVEEIRFENVTFEYRPGTAVIRDFSLSVPGGSVVALVGPSGAGKTTLTDLVARFYDPTAGTISLNGVDLRRLRLRSYRSLLAVVQQETFLFDGTAAENISYGRRGVTNEDITDAARRANALGFIEQLPEGFQTLIGERGFKLSGGQKQRISIARAILADPQILILDEATSNLDTESEQLIQASLQELLKHRTTFVIAHRLSTITHADLIVVMEAGQIVEVGGHEELMAKGGSYFEMVERQRRSMGVGAELFGAGEAV
ncbi:MAG: transporter transrane region [Phycisphaerales bacterium]|nr:transporter transrane region [Phycisphaerales bacterium]